ncbi:hypothetical protein [Hoeflea sp.]|uniref:hypothetical protein n=1 Tax=Hoeflea sp. TaxID=1940281 RepID=UPI00374944B3
MSIKSRVAQGAVEHARMTTHRMRRESLPSKERIAENYRYVLGTLDQDRPGQFQEIHEVLPVAFHGYRPVDFKTINSDLHLARMTPGVSSETILEWHSGATQLDGFQRLLLSKVLQPVSVKWLGPRGEIANDDKLPPGNKALQSREPSRIFFEKLHPRKVNINSEISAEGNAPDIVIKLSSGDVVMIPDDFHKARFFRLEGTFSS